MIIYFKKWLLINLTYHRIFNMDKNLFIFSAEPFHKKIFFDLEMDKLIKNKFRINYIDISTLIFDHQNIPIYSVQHVNNVRISTFWRFLKFIRKNIDSSTYVIWYVPLILRSYCCLFLLNYFTTKIAFIKIGCSPQSIIENNFKILKREIKTKLIASFHYLRILSPFAITFYCGDEARNISPLSLKYVSIPHYDFKSFNFQHSSASVRRRYIIFLDNSLTDHPDIKAISSKQLDKEKYFEALGKLFDELEKKFDAEIIISGHPKITYSDNNFGGRRIIRGKTQSLVENCELVIAHNTSSISFASFYKKKVLFITSNEINLKLKVLNIPQIILHNANFFKTSPINIDNLSIENIDKYFSNFDLSKCELYINKFLLSASGVNEINEAIDQWVSKYEK